MQRKLVLSCGTQRNKAHTFIRQSEANKLPGCENVGISQENLNSPSVDSIPADFLHVMVMPSLTVKHLEFDKMKMKTTLKTKESMRKKHDNQLQDLHHKTVKLMVKFCALTSYKMLNNSQKKRGTEFLRSEIKAEFKL